MKETRDINVIYGRNSVKEAIRANKVKAVFLTDSFSDKEILSLISNHHIPSKVVSIGELNAKCDGVHQGIMAEAKPYEYHSLDEIITKSKKETNPIVVILDGINDPHNLGAILRSADVFGAMAVIIGKHNQVPLNATVAKSSAGAINFVPTVLVNNLNQAIATLKENGFWVVSTDGSATIDYRDLAYDFPTAVVIGSEGYGASSLVLKNSDYIVKIPQKGHVNSLNASVACGILLSRIVSK